QSVGLGMDEAIIGCLEDPLAQSQRALDPAGEKPPADRASAVAVEEARGKEAMRVEHPDPERAATGPAQSDQGTGGKRLCRNVDPHFVRIDPGVAALGAPMA